MPEPHAQADALRRRDDPPASQAAVEAPRVAYFVQDVSDPAVRRRVEMLTAGGAGVALAGFRRRAEPVSDLAGAAVIDLGRTYDARLLHRAVKTLLSPLAALTLAPQLKAASAVIARNLEMLLVAQAVRSVAGARAPLFYEVLDIHRVMLRRDAVGKVMRWVERRLMTGVAGVIVSSPAFEREYFNAVQAMKPQALLLENKTPEGWGSGLAKQAPPHGADGGAGEASPQEAPPWRIAWFGKIRCQKSLDLLDGLTRALDGRLRVELRGQPSYTAFRDFAAQVAANPALRFSGPYDHAELPRLYGECHFVWGIDYYEENQNSDWLLPNRLYEGGAAGLPILALERVETGRWLAAKGAGVLLRDPQAELDQFFSALTAEKYGALRKAAAGIPRQALVTGLEECRSFVERICG